METADQTTERVENLLVEWMNNRDITWAADDESTKAKLKGILERGMAYLCKRAGTPSLAFVGDVKSLLFDYCRYDLNNCREEFETAFVGELNTLRLSEGFDCGKEAAG